MNALKAWFHRRTLYAFHLEELLFLCFLALYAAVFSPRDWQGFTFYQDRITYFLLLVSSCILTFRINLILLDSRDFAWSRIIDCGKWFLGILRDYISLIFCWSMYMCMQGLLAYRELADDRLIAADRWLFGVDPSVWLQRFISPGMTLFLTCCYLGMFVYMVVLLAFLQVTGNRQGLREYTLALVLGGFFGYAGYWLVPAIGPKFTLESLYSVDLWNNPAVASAKASLEFIDKNRIPTDCFPSMHSGFSLIALLFAWRWSKKLFVLLLPFVSGLLAATVYLRYHYVIDVIAGAVLAIGCYLGCPRLVLWWEARGKALTPDAPAGTVPSQSSPHDNT